MYDIELQMYCCFSFHYFNTASFIKWDYPQFVQNLDGNITFRSVTMKHCRVIEKLKVKFQEVGKRKYRPENT